MQSLENFDFDNVFNRKGSNSYKWDNTEVIKQNLLPLSVADMDFEISSEITKALLSRIIKPIYGYEFQPDSLKESIIAWASSRHGFEIKPEWILFTPGVLCSLAASVLTFTQKGDYIVIQPPVYPPFSNIITKNDRHLLFNPLHYNPESLRYTMDFNSLEKIFSEMKPKLLFVCNPHNPIGRVWTKQEIQTLGELCKKYNVIIVSDDIHADLIMPGHKYNPVINSSKSLKKRSIQLMSPGKSFNIPGLRFSYAVIADEKLRQQYADTLSATALTNTNIMAVVAAQAAYQKGERWLNNVLDYIWQNYLILKKHITHELSWVKLIPLEGTFLAWLDLRGSGLNYTQLSYVIHSKAKLMLFDGHKFGESGQGFMRLNLACPRKTLNQAIERLVTELNHAKEKPVMIGIMDQPDMSCRCCG